MVRLGRCFVEFTVNPGSANARVFDPESPARKAFTGLKWYPPNPALQVKARFMASPSPSPVTIITSRGLQREYFRVGAFEFAIDGRALRLTALSGSATLKDGDELFLAFRDATTGAETYDVGRYLFVPFAGADAQCILDFNLASDPLCNQHLRPGRRISDELDVAAVLRGDTKPETAEDTDGLIAGRPTKLWHTTAALRSSRAASGTLAGQSQRGLRRQGGELPPCAGSRWSHRR